MKHICLQLVTLSLLSLCLGAVTAQEYSAWGNYKQAARLAAENGPMDQIVSLCKNAQKQTETPILYARAAFLLAEVYGRNALFDEAHKVLQRVISREEELPSAIVHEARLRKGFFYLKQGETENALSLLQKVADQDSNSFYRTEALFALGWHQANQGNWRACDSLLQEVQTVSPGLKNDQRGILLNARSQIAHNNPTAAIELLKNISEPNSLKYLATAYEQANKQIMAVSIYKKIHDSLPHTREAEQALFQAAEVFMRAEDWLAAKSEYERLLQFYPESELKDAVHFRLGWIHLKLGNFKQALREFPSLSARGRFENLDAVLVKSLYRAAQCYYRLQYYTQAIETWQKLVTNFPQSDLAPDAYFHLADTYFRANHFAEADTAFLNIIDHYPDNPFAVESALRLGQSAYNSGNYELAVERYQTFMNTYPNHEKSKEALEGIQLSYYQLGQTEQATEVLQKVVEQAQNADLAADAKYQIAVNLAQSEQYDEAIIQFKEVLTEYPNSTFSMDAQYSLAKSLIAVADYQEAARELKRFVEYFPNSSYLPEVYYLLGVSFFNLESYLSAIDNFNKIVTDYAESEFHASALQNIGWCFDKLREAESALDYFDQYLSRYPDAEDRFVIYMQEAKLLNQIHQTDKAIAIFQELKKSDVPEIAAEAAFQLGLHYVNQQQISEAEAEFKLAIEQGEKDNYYRLSAIAQLAAIYENTDQNEKAVQMYELLVSSTEDEQWVNAAKERMNVLAPLMSTKMEK